MNPKTFLSDFSPRSWTPGYGLQPAGLFLGKGTPAIEVAAAQSHRKPNGTDILKVWRERRGGRATPVLVVVIYPKGSTICGPTGEVPPVRHEISSGLVERLCREVLHQPDRHAALRFLSQALPSLETELPGINNEGLLALHELRTGVRNRSDWKEAGQRAAATVGKRDFKLLDSLGFQIEQIDNLTSLLKDGVRRTALAVVLRESESPEVGNARFNSLSPISYALKKADDEGVSWVLLTQGSRIRLYSTSTNDGVGRRSRTETYVECQSSLMSQEDIAYLWLLFSAEALSPTGSLHQILLDSRRFTGDLADRLRERIYDHVVPTLAQGIVVARNLKSPTAQELAHSYEMALTVLFRLLFIAYAEDCDLLPYRSNDAYRRRSLKQKAQDLADCIANDIPVAEGDSHWQEVGLLWGAVAAGNPQWGVSAYDGGLFAADPDVSRIGAALATVALPNKTFEVALRQLLVIETPEGTPGPVDFRSLGVREFGTIYEGLLESELALADVDLTLNKSNTYSPVHSKHKVIIKRGEVYIHNRSGVRKSTGSYYTKPFAVEHLLTQALEPALNDHFARLANMNDADAAEAFFDFRVADIAMGSGHFLIGAIDRIEKRMADWLTTRRLPGVHKELATLRAAALAQIPDTHRDLYIEDCQLLRRLIARRCIYGVDLNALSVQLARLAVWIHTFVPGLPLSFLDRNLVRGNSLVGIGNIDEIERQFRQRSGTLFAGDPESLLGMAKRPLERLAVLNDATLADIAAARNASKEARSAIAQTEHLCDLITAQPISDDPTVIEFPFEEWEHRVAELETTDAAAKARKALRGMHTLHFPVIFPEVFLRPRSGFDVILGNPPWEKVKVEEHTFWARHSPGLRGLSQNDQEAEKIRLRSERPDLSKLYQAEKAEMELTRKVLVSSSYPGMGTGDPDLYKAFCWRFWHLAAQDGGRIGVVLPRSALAAKGSANFRKAMYKQSESVELTMLLNNKRWVFPEVHPQYSVGLVAITRGTPRKNSIHLLGPFTSAESFLQGIRIPAESFNYEEVLKWNDSASLPLLPDPDSVAVFAQLRKAPRLDLSDAESTGGGGVGVWRVRPDREMDATLQKSFMEFNLPNKHGEQDLSVNSTQQRKRTS